jgi:uncharacterized SAM-binding protein YcdF (DUF218 family)
MGSAAVKKIFFFLLVAGSAAAFVCFYHVPLLQAYAKFFTVHTAHKGADAIVVLAGIFETRIPRAADLCRQGYGPRILITQERPLNVLSEQLQCSNSQKARALLELLHVECDLTRVPSLKGGATSTFDEAYDLRDWAQKHAYRRIIIVTDHFHTRRALYAFKKIFKGTDIAVEAAGAPNDCFSEDNWWKSDTGISCYILEGVKYLVYCFSSRNFAGIKNF